MSKENILPLVGVAPCDDSLPAAIEGHIEGPGTGGRTVLRIARIVWGQSASLGIVRNISSTGLTLEVPGNLQLEGPVDIDMGPRTLKGTLQWRDGLSAGVRLLEPIDVDQVLEKHEVDQDGRVIRSPRVAVTFPAEIGLTSGWRPVEVRDISVGGARIAFSGQVGEGEHVQLKVPAHDPIHGQVRWARNGEVGIAFQRPIRISWLMSWLSSPPDEPSSARTARPRKFHLEAIVIGAILAASYLNAAAHLLH